MELHVPGNSRKIRHINAAERLRAEEDEVGIVECIAQFVAATEVEYLLHARKALEILDVQPYVEWGREWRNHNDTEQIREFADQNNNRTMEVSNIFQEKIA